MNAIWGVDDVLPETVTLYNRVVDSQSQCSSDVAEALVHLNWSPGVMPKPLNIQYLACLTTATDDDPNPAVASKICFPTTAGEATPVSTLRMWGDRRRGLMVDCFFCNGLWATAAKRSSPRSEEGEKS